MTAHVFSAIAPGIVLTVFSFVWLRRAGFDPLIAALVTVLASAQSGVAIAMVEPGHSLWLAIGVGAVAASAAAYAGRNDARGVILVGGSLAAIQICDPMGGLIAAGVIPIAVMVAHDRAETPRAVGLVLLLLFLPLMTGLILLYLTRALHIDPTEFLRASSTAWRWPGGIAERFVPVAGLGLILLPSLSGLRRSQGGQAILLVAAVLLASAIFDGLLGTLREPVTLLAAAAPLTIGAVAEHRTTARSNLAALVAAGIAFILSWIVVLALVPAALGWG